jgi:hypothetical protein
MASLNFDWIFLQIYNLFTKPQNFTSIIPSPVKTVFVTILTLVSIFFLVVIVYAVMRLKERSEENRNKLHEAIHSSKIHDEAKDDKIWQGVIDHIKSNNPSDWRLSIIEADNMLDVLTREIGLPGNNLGERLKSASPNNFKHLDRAWEAHRLRNKIAHEGLSFKLDYTEAKRAIESYEIILKEFGFI